MADRSSERSPWVTLRTVAVAASWLLLTRMLPQYAWHAVPRALLNQLTLPTYSMICQILTTALGVGMTRLWLARPRAALGLERCSWSTLLVSALLAPALFVISSRVALTLAEPYLLAELAVKGGEGASRRNAGEFGRAVTEAPILLNLLWGGVLAAFSEELLFRGVLMTAFRQLMPGRAARLGAGSAVILSALAFAAMHADMPGSVGIVRVVASACLGLGCGVARWLCRSVWAAMAVHFVYNSVSLGLGRGWFGSSDEALLPAVPNGLLFIASAGAIVATALSLARRSRPPAA